VKTLGVRMLFRKQCDGHRAEQAEHRHQLFPPYGYSFKNLSISVSSSFSGFS
jgi:hypothetical protein